MNDIDNNIEYAVPDESSVIAMELNEIDRQLKKERSHRLSTSPDKFILIASATEASKHRKSSFTKASAASKSVKDDLLVVTRASDF